MMAVAPGDVHEQRVLRFFCGRTTPQRPLAARHRNARARTSPTSAFWFNRVEIWSIARSFAVQTHHGEVEAQEAPVPPSALRPVLACGIGVVVELRAHIDRRPVWEGIVFQ
jgi:hypothetical protein